MDITPPLPPLPPLPRLHFERVTPAYLSFLRVDSAVNFLIGDPLTPISLWLVDGEQINVRLLRPLELLGETAMVNSQRRDTPGDLWGRLEMVRADVGLTEMQWTKTPAGYDIPAPKPWITERLARRLSDDGTQALRWEVQPAPGTSITRFLYPPN